MSSTSRWTGTGRGGALCAAAVAVLLGLLTACASSAADEHPAPGAMPIVFESQVERDPSASDPRVQAGLEALVQAVAAEDDAVARIQLERLFALDPGPELLAVLEKYAMLLEGRRLARSIQLGLATEAATDGGEATVLQVPLRLLLTVRHAESEPLHLRFHPLELRELATSVRLVPLPDPGLPKASRLDALEQRVSARRAVDALADLVIEPGQTQVIDLGLQRSTVADALAVRHFWKLTSRSGTVELDGQRYPVQHVAPATAEAVRLAPWLPAAAVPPAEWVRYALGAELSQAALMERAVRIELERRDEALDLLTAELDDLPTLRMQELVPAVRWLARTIGPGGHGEAWAQWLRARERGALTAPDGDAGESEPDRGGGLDLPLERSSTREP